MAAAARVARVRAAARASCRTLDEGSGDEGGDDEGGDGGDGDGDGDGDGGDGGDGDEGDEGGPRRAPSSGRGSSHTPRGSVCGAAA